MTTTKLQEIVLRLANSVPTRYWLRYTSAYPGEARPWLMAIHVSYTGGEESVLASLKDHESRREWADGLGWVHLIERTNEDGTPYTTGETA